MKYEFRYCHTFFLVNALAGFLAGAGIISKFVCPGDSVQAFQNITFNNCSSVVSLYIKGERNLLIARWSFENCSRNETFLPDYNGRLFLDCNGTISIHDVHPWDQAKYIAYSQMGEESMEDIVEIKVMAAPANDCVPKILDLGSSLFASLKASFCGKPVATLYWKGDGDVPNTSDPVLKLNPGNQDGTYYACIKGPALTCVGNALDYCSKFTVGDKPPPQLLEFWDVKMVVLVVVGIVLFISLILAPAVILIRMYCRKPISRPLKEAMVIDRANGNVRVAFGKRAGGREVKHTNYEPGLARAIIGSDDNSDDLHDEHCLIMLPTNQHSPTHDDDLSGQQTVPLDKKYELGIKHFDNLSGQQTVPSEKRRELWNEHFDSLTWKHIKQLLNDKQQQGLKNDYESEDKPKELAIDHQPITNA